jgi:hypothetical protein
MMGKTQPLVLDFEDLEVATPVEEFTPSGVVPRVAPVDPLADLLEVLDPVHISSVLVGREPRVSIPSDPGRASGIANEVAMPPRYFAQSTHIKTVITHEELEALVARGATRQGDVQRIEVPPNPNGTAYSVRCADCRRWIACIAREGKCVCGQANLVVVDELVADAIPEGRRCMNCGARYENADAREQRSPWRRLNEGQSICAVCMEMPNAGAWHLADE